METVDDLVKAIEGIGAWSRRMEVMFKNLSFNHVRLSRKFSHEAHMWKLRWDLYRVPNNKRKMDGVPMILRRAYKKAWRNERRK